MRIGIANDHASVEMKKELVAYLESQGHEVINYGTDLSESTDYPIWGEKVSMAVANGEVERGIAICGTGVGIGIACNSRLHNNANVIAFGSRVIGIETAKMLVDEFMNTEFEGGRHERRVNMVMDIEARNF